MKLKQFLFFVVSNVKAKLTIGRSELSFFLDMHLPDVFLFVCAIPHPHYRKLTRFQTNEKYTIKANSVNRIG